MNLKNCLSRIKNVAFVICFLCVSFKSYAQQFDPFDGKAASFHINLTRYFKNADDEKTTRTLLMDSIKQFKQDTSWTIENLRTHLDSYEELLVSLKKHYSYYEIKNYVNNKDSIASESENLLEDTINTLNTMVNHMVTKPGITAIPQNELSKYNLSKYQYLLNLAKQKTIHKLADNESRLLSKLSNPILGHLTNRYDALMDSIKADKIQTSAKDSVSRKKARMPNIKLMMTMRKL
jgi:oligoendopeptidase F